MIKSTLVQVMAVCHPTKSYYLNQCWPSFVSPYGITRGQWVNVSPPMVFREKLIFAWPFHFTAYRAQSKIVPSQWETWLQCNHVSHWLGAYLDWSLCPANERCRYNVTTSSLAGHIPRLIPVLTVMEAIRNDLFSFLFTLFVYSVYAYRMRLHCSSLSTIINNMVFEEMLQ